MQEFVEGAILDPWSLFGQDPLDILRQSRFSTQIPDRSWVPLAIESITTFVRHTRKMIAETGYIPDLAGNGNLILTKKGNVKLVDINNILRVQQTDAILLDDKDYPACDKSIEVLFILEEKIIKSKDLAKDALYGHFLSAERTRRVKQLEYQFFHNPPLFSETESETENVSHSR